MNIQADTAASYTPRHGYRNHRDLTRLRYDWQRLWSTPGYEGKHRAPEPVDVEALKAEHTIAAHLDNRAHTTTLSGASA